MTRQGRGMSPLVVVVAAAITLAVPGVAQAARGLWVNGSTAVGSGTSCASPGYNTVQAAVDAAPSGGQVNVCAGTYTEQIEIGKPLKLALAQGGKATLQLPASPTPSLSSCDTAEGLEPGQIDEVSICTPGKVSITGLKIVALAPIETCAGGLNAIYVAGGAELSAVTDEIVGASTTLNAFKGCQHGIAVEIGSHRANEVGHATLERDAISGYEKNGPTATNPGSTLVAKEIAVTGEGPSPYIAQNGIEVAFGAKGQVSNTNVTGNECELAGVCGATALEEQATGVLFYGAAAGSKLSESTLGNNDIGAYYASTAATLPAKADVSFNYDKLNSDRYEGYVLEQGRASIKGGSVSGTGQAGIFIVQAASQAYADASKAIGVTIEGMSVASIQVGTDGLPGDPPGVFSIKNSSISKSAAEFLDPSANYTITQKNDS